MPFELKWTPELLLDEVRRVVALMPDGPITQDFFAKHSDVSVATLRRCFGDWSDVLTAAGHPDRYGGRRISAKMRHRIPRCRTGRSSKSSAASPP